MDYRPFITIAEEWVLEQIDFPSYTDGDITYTLLDKGIIFSVARNEADILNGTVAIDPDEETNLDIEIDVYAYQCVEAEREGEIGSYEEWDPRYRVQLYARTGKIKAGAYGQLEEAVVRVEVDESIVDFDRYVQGPCCDLPRSQED